MNVVSDVVCNGVFWDALSSVATIAATITALYLARRDNVKRMDVVLIWDQIEHYQPALFISNIGTKPIPLKNISLYYQGRLIFNSNVLEDFRTNTFSRYLILPNTSQKTSWINFISSSRTYSITSCLEYFMLLPAFLQSENGTLSSK